MALTARARLAGNMRFEVEVGSGHLVTLDADADDGGRNAGPGPMEIVLVGLAGCVGMTVLAILRKKRQDVIGYELRLQGTQATEHPHVFLEIAVEHTVTGRNVDPVAVARAIELAETRYCPVSAMLAKTAAIAHNFRIVAATG
jgi:putative redox protein